MSPRRRRYVALLTVLGLATAAYGLIRREVFWVFVGLAWLFLAVTQATIARRR